jgi:o-succinylbenzoate synthase
MNVTGVSWQGFAVPFKRPYVTAGTRATHRYGLLLFLRTDTGFVGVGEASPVGVGSREELEAVAAQIEGLAPRLLEMDLGRRETMEFPLGAEMSPVIRFGLETAFLDLMGKEYKRSVAELLGGSSQPVPVNALIAAETPQEAQAKAADAVAGGFSSLKLKVARESLEGDEALVSTVRRAVGPGVRLRIDPNAGWSVSQAVEAVRRLARYDLEYVEQPVPANDLAGLKDVRSAVSVPIAADEALDSIDDLKRLLAMDAADVVIIKVGRLGGLHRAKEMIRLAEGIKKAVVVTSSLESGVGIVASAQLASTLAMHPFAHGLGTGLLLEHDLVSVPLSISQGMLSVPTGPGLGVEVDREALDRYKIGIIGSVGFWPRA